MKHIPGWLLLLGLGLFASPGSAQEESADLIFHNAKILTVDKDFHIVEALAIKDGRVLAIGEDEDILKRQGPQTKVVDVRGGMILPGLYDSHVHPTGAALSEFAGPLPRLTSLAEVFTAIRKKAAEQPEGQWIVLNYAFPTRLKEARFPTLKELDEAAPKHPVRYNAGPVDLVNSAAMKLLNITRDTPNPRGGVVVKDPKTGEPTGVLRNAASLIRGIPSPREMATPEQQREAIKTLFRLYNEQGLTSIADRNGTRGSLDTYRELHKKGELTLRVNVARSFNPHGTREEVVRRFEELPGGDKSGGPTGVGDEYVRIGPIKLFLDGGMLNGTAYMRQPWPMGETYQITEEGYRGLLFIARDQLEMVVEEGARRQWQMTAHTAGEGAMDVLLDSYHAVNRRVPIKDLRFCITHANFPSQRNLELCKELNVCADVQPAWLYKDGNALRGVLGEDRMRWFQPYKSWLEYTTVGGGSDHMIRLDSLDSTNPWNPWLGIWTTLTRATERGKPLRPDEKLTREQAIRLYTINNAYLNHEEKFKGSLEPGKVADLILVNQDLLTCPVQAVRQTKVLLTVVGGKVVYERGK